MNLDEATVNLDEAIDLWSWTLEYVVANWQQLVGFVSHTQICKLLLDQTRENWGTSYL